VAGSPRQAARAARLFNDELKETTIMANQAYFPASEADRVVWLTHFRAKLPAHAAELSLATDELANILADIDFYVWILHTLNPAAQQYAQENTAYKLLIATGAGSDAVPVPAMPIFDQPPAPRPPGVLPRLFNFVQRLKINTVYTESIGQDLGVIGSQDTSVHPIPDFTATTERL
jgi:hypothetical protein